MGRVRVKICGITSQNDSQLAVQLGADAIGLNLFAGSKRYVSFHLAQEIALTLPPLVEPVVLLVNQSLGLSLATAMTISRTIQWHGEDPPLPPDTSWRFLPAFHIANADCLAMVTGYLDRCRSAGRLPDAVVLDGHAAGQYGGTGQPAPWELLAGFDPGVPVILAGGLTPENVAEAIRIVRPYAVDVASGVESAPGRKDPGRVRAFMAAVAG